jgi:DNA-binding CsgD family transcriptional regulator
MTFDQSAMIVNPEPPTAGLSVREVEVLLAWLRSDNKTAVARELYITSATVSTHISRIREKYDSVGRPASTKATLVARALQDGLIALADL